MDLRQYTKGALSAAIAAAVAFVSLNYVNVDVAEPYKQIVALLAVALYNRFQTAPRNA